MIVFCPFTREPCVDTSGLRQRTCRFFKKNRCGLFDELISALRDINKAPGATEKTHGDGTRKSNFGSPGP